MSNFGRFRTASPRRGRSGFGRSRLGRPIRPYEWVPFLLNTTVIPPATVFSINVLPEAVAEEMNDPTVMRTRALVTMIPPDPITAGVALGVIGMQVVDGDDPTLHDPFNTGDSSDWFVWQPYTVSYEANSASIGAQGLYLDLDSRSRRRVGPRNHAVNMFISNNGGASIVVAAVGRMLFKS